MAYIDALKRLEFLVSEAKGADRELLDKANQIISQSLELQKEAFSVIGKAYDSACNDNQELEDDILSQFMFMNDFDEIEKESQKQEEKKEHERECKLLKISRLDPSGFTETNKALHDCAGEIVKKAKALFKSEPVPVCLHTGKLVRGANGQRQEPDDGRLSRPVPWERRG
ncbi:hypothetical protein, partial [Photorhabdus temperata]|uniref:hypothetical protein n=1 Tax=Photorhabdus temperata TaxID=574560 RepID=UPI0004CEA081